MLQNNIIHLIGYASGIAAGDSGCGEGPMTIQKSGIAGELNKLGWQVDWATLTQPQAMPALAATTKLCKQLADITKNHIENKQFFTVLGGDHSCAIGTWSGVARALDKQGPLGLLWFDAHMDSHTFETTKSGNIHGMPLASLLGFGAPELTNISTAMPKLAPEHVCLIGVRSFESGEAELIQRLGVRVYFMEEIQQRGLDVVVQEALEKVKQGTAAFGISIDLDGIDPQDAPGVGTPELNGMSGVELVRSLQTLAVDPKLIAAEVVEYNPYHDKRYLTINLIHQLLFALLPRRI